MKTTPQSVIDTPGVLGLALSSQGTDLVEGDSTLPLHVISTFSIKGVGPSLGLHGVGVTVVANEIDGVRVAISVDPNSPITKSVRRLVKKLVRWAKEQKPGPKVEPSATDETHAAAAAGYLGGGEPTDG